MSSKRELPVLTALKGIFCLIIAFHNTMLAQLLFDDVPGVSFIYLYGGTLGNSVFLTISGFLFAYNYRSKVQNHEMPFFSFMARRFLKLYPLYLITNGISLVLSIIKYGPSVINLTRIASILLLQAFDPYNAPTWFLIVLFACYIAFYFISYNAKNDTQYFCGISLFVLLAFSLQSGLPFFGPRYCFAYLNFFAGCILAELYPIILKKGRTWLPHVCLACLACIAYLLLKFGVEIISGNVDKGFSLCITPLILCIALSDNIYARILQCKPLVYLGKISTSVYFWHWPVYLFFTEVIVGGPISEKQYMIYAALLCFCSILSFRYIEGRRKHSVPVNNQNK